MVKKKIKLIDFFYTKEDFEASLLEIEEVEKGISKILLDFLKDKPVYLTVYSQIKPEFKSKVEAEKKKAEELKAIEQEKPQQKNEPKVQLLLRTYSTSLKSAVMKLIRRRQLEKGAYDWHLGISSNNILMFDIDEVIDEHEVLQFAEKLKAGLNKKYNIQNEVITIRTTNGYHVVSDASLTEEQWIAENKAVLESIKDETLDLPIDLGHLELNIKYESTTLRISPKHGRNEIYRTIKVV